MVLKALFILLSSAPVSSKPVSSQQKESKGNSLKDAPGAKNPATSAGISSQRTHDSSIAKYNGIPVYDFSSSPYVYKMNDASGKKYETHDEGPKRPSWLDSKSGQKPVIYSINPEAMQKHYSWKKPDPTLSQFQRLKYSIDQKRGSYGEQKKPWGERFKTGIKNLENMVANAVDMTVGRVLAEGQNYLSVRDMKKNPNKELVWIRNGFSQNEGNAWRKAREFRKKGYAPIITKVYNHLPIEEQYERFLQEIDRYHAKMNLDPKSIPSRYDGFHGHSSGGNFGIYAAQQEQTKKKGIKYVQAVAPTPYGLDMKTPSQKILNLFYNLDHEDRNKPEGRAYALKLHKKPPVIDVHVVAGANDGLVPVKDTFYKHAKKHYIIDHPASTHFGTAGSNHEMNKVLADLYHQHRKGVLQEKAYNTSYYAKKAA